MLDNSYHCQSCGAVIPLEDVNVSNDIALCRACGKTMQFSTLVPLPGAASVNLQHPPKGVRIEDDPLRGKSIIYRKISPIVLFLIPFTAAWSGLSMTGIYGTQIREGKFDLFRTMFGLPFLIGTVCLVAVILFLLLGRWRVTVSRDQLAVALEVGPFGWTRRIACDRSARVSMKLANYRTNNVPQSLIHVECQGNILKFGAMMPDEVKNFIAEATRRTLAGG